MPVLAKVIINAHFVLFLPKRSPNSITHMHTQSYVFIVGPATVVWRGTECIYITYSSVTAWMGGSQTEKESGGVVLKAKAEEQMLCNFSWTEVQ